MTGRPGVLVPPGTDKNDVNISHGEVHFARRNYLEKLFQVDLVPILISPFTDMSDALSIQKECSGLFLMGGDDVDASHYSQTNHEQNVLVVPEQDQIEIALVQAALKIEMPVLGICRGAQIMAVACGGSLHQHLPEFSHTISHAPAAYLNYHEWVISCEHNITIEPGSRAADILGNSQGPLLINSAHHQAVDNCGECLRVTAYSSDGIAEIIEHMNPKVFAFGIQSHPEVAHHSPLHNFFGAFAQACLRYRSCA